MHDNMTSVLVYSILHEENTSISVVLAYTKVQELKLTVGLFHCMHRGNQAGYVMCGTVEHLTYVCYICAFSPCACHT